MAAEPQGARDSGEIRHSDPPHPENSARLWCIATSDGPDSAATQIGLSSLGLATVKCPAKAARAGGFLPRAITPLAVEPPWQNTFGAIRRHRVCTAFNGGCGLPEVQPRWRRSRYLPLGRRASARFKPASACAIGSAIGRAWFVADPPSGGSVTSALRVDALGIGVAAALREGLLSNESFTHGAPPGVANAPLRPLGWSFPNGEHQVPRQGGVFPFTR